MKAERAISLAIALLCLAAGCGKRSEPLSLDDAIRKGDVELVKRLIARGANVNRKNRQGETSLYVVADEGDGNVAIAEVLIAQGADVNEGSRARFGPIRTVLHKAAERGQGDLVALLLRHGADVDAKDVDGRTPLFDAAWGGHREVVEMLLAHGADIKADGWQGQTALHAAAERGYADLVQLLLAGGVAVDTKDRGGRMPLHCAAGEGRMAIVEILLAQGADIDAADEDGCTPLYTAALYGHEELVDLLLSRGARIDSTRFGERLLHAAASDGLLNLARRLLADGVNINARDEHWGRLPLAWALDGGHVDVARLLIAHDADMPEKNGRDDPIVFSAVRIGDVGLLRLMLSHGMEVDNKDGSGHAVLHAAVRRGDLEIVRELIAHYADVNARTWGGTTPLHYAVAEGHVEMVRLLLANDADIDAQDNDGDTALHTAAARGHEGIAQLLLSHGCIPDAKDNQGRTPLDEAVRRGHEEIVQLLRGRHASSAKAVPVGRDRQGRLDPTNNLSTARPVSDANAEAGSLRVQKVPLSATDQARRNVRLLVEGNSVFAVDLYRQLAGRSGNLFFSPYGISLALGMTYAGARENTATEMAHTLHFSLGQSDLHPAFAQVEVRMTEIQKAGDVRLTVANALWPQQGRTFLPEYLSLVRDCYGVSITPVDYRGEQARAIALKTINTWVEGKTENRIRDLLQPEHLDDSTRLVLTNAIYFKGDWEDQFDPNDTRGAPFYVAPAQSVTVPMMTQTERVRYAELTDLQIVELAYRGGVLSMLVLLPKARDGLPSVEQRFSTPTLDRWRRSLNEREVMIFMPRLRTTCTAELKKTLTAMGMVDAFTWPGANFAGFDGDAEWFYIGEVVHKAYVDVNEEGTEAAAATAVVTMFGGGPPRPAVFRADHPFLFLIQDNRTGSILFMGRVVDPTNASQ